MVNQQIPLRIRLEDAARFENFYVHGESDANGRLLRYLKSRQPPVLYLYGSFSTGISHLLMALCYRAEKNKLTVQYVPLKELISGPDDLLRQIETPDLVCIDDIEELSASLAWQESLFYLYNELKDRGCALVFGGHTSPTALDIQLADLKSRILAGETWAVCELEEEGKRCALQSRAVARGFELPDAVADYLIKRQNRDMSSLMRTLDQLDRLSLEQKKIITLPFVKSLLGYS